MIPSQFSIADLIIYISNGVYAVLMVVLAFPGIEHGILFDRITTLTTAQGFAVAVPGLFAFYIAGAIAVALADLVSAVCSKDGNDSYCLGFDHLHSWLVLAVHPGVSRRRSRAISSLMNFRLEFIERVNLKLRQQEPSARPISSGGLFAASLFPCIVSPTGDDLVSRSFTLRTFHKTIAVLSWMTALSLLVGLILGWYFETWRLGAMFALVFLGTIAAFRSDRLYVHQMELMNRNGYFWLANPALGNTKT